MVVQNGLRLSSTPRFEAQADFGIFVAEDTGGEKSGGRGPGGANGERADGNASGHLNNREKRVHAVENAAFDGYAQNRKYGVGRHHAGQVGSSACGGDNYFQSSGSGFLG